MFGKNFLIKKIGVKMTKIKWNPKSVLPEVGAVVWLAYEIEGMQFQANAIFSGDSFSIMLEPCYDFEAFFVCMEDVCGWMPLPDFPDIERTGE